MLIQADKTLLKPYSVFTDLSHTTSRAFSFLPGTSSVNIFLSSCRNCSLLCFLGFCEVKFSNLSCSFFRNRVSIPFPSVFVVQKKPTVAGQVPTGLLQSIFWVLCVGQRVFKTSLGCAGLKVCGRWCAIQTAGPA